VARRGFDPRRSVRLDAFLFRRVVEAARARYRPEWSFGSRVRLDDGLGVASVLAAGSRPPRAQESSLCFFEFTFTLGQALRLSGKLQIPAFSLERKCEMARFRNVVVFGDSLSDIGIKATEKAGLLT
jgi:hypothetical protein